MQFIPPKGSVTLDRVSLTANEVSGPRFDGYVALGCVIRGETTHYDHICAEGARGLQDLAVRGGLAIGYGILTCETRPRHWPEPPPRAATMPGRQGAPAWRSSSSSAGLSRAEGEHRSTTIRMTRDGRLRLRRRT
jgi:6,7-dimethyl-8-ribityllumazine synthase